MSIDLEDRIRRLERRVATQRTMFVAAVTVAVVFACRSSSSEPPAEQGPITIGRVTIDKKGIKVVDDMGTVTIGGGEGIIATSALGSKITIQTSRIAVEGNGTSATLTALGAASLELKAGKGKARISVDPTQSSLALEPTDDATVLVTASEPATTVIAKNGVASASLFARNAKEATIGATFDKHEASLTSDAKKARAAFDK
ncbi:MAG TPA: hypothetical protein VGO00_29915 [Kofleriaceae bacterium]|jgi:hypothetical protein|nr:hypothetical protein [Kofleriaceae bacterium]